MMMIFEISYPGTRLNMRDPNLAFELEKALMAVESSFSEAAVILGLFEQSQQELLSSMMPRTDQPREDTTQPPDLWELASKCGTDGQAFQLELSRLTLEAKRDRWRAGELPRAYTSRLPFIYARAFMFSLWNIKKLLNSIVQYLEAPGAAAVKEFNAALPTLRGMRDSSAHLDERLAGKAHRRKIALKPLNTQFIHAPSGGILVSESLVGNKFVGTMANGDLGEVEVSADKMNIVKHCVQGVINSLPWSGAGRQYPE